MAARFDRYTVKAQEAVQNAQQLAESRGHRSLVPLHLLKALLDETDGIMRPLLQKIGANVNQLSGQVDNELKRMPSSSGSNVGLSLSTELNKVFETAQAQADQMRDQFVSTEHLFLALTKVDDAAKRLLHVNGVEESDVLNALKSVRGINR